MIWSPQTFVPFCLLLQDLNNQYLDGLIKQMDGSVTVDSSFSWYKVLHIYEVHEYSWSSRGLERPY